MRVGVVVVRGEFGGTLLGDRLTLSFRLGLEDFRLLLDQLLSEVLGRRFPQSDKLFRVGSQDLFFVPCFVEYLVGSGQLDPHLCVKAHTKFLGQTVLLFDGFGELVRQLAELVDRSRQFR